MRKATRTMLAAGLAVLLIAVMAGAQMGMSSEKQPMMSKTNSPMSDTTYNMLKQMSDNHQMMEQDLQKLQNQTSMMMKTSDMTELRSGMQKQMDMMNMMQGMMSNQDKMYNSMMSMMGMNMGSMQSGMMQDNKDMSTKKTDPVKDSRATKDWSSKSASMNDTQKTFKQMSDNHQMLGQDLRNLQNQTAMIMKSNDISTVKSDLQKEMETMSSMHRMMASQDEMYKSMMASSGMSMQTGEKMPSKTMDMNKGTMKDDKK